MPPHIIHMGISAFPPPADNAYVLPSRCMSSLMEGDGRSWVTHTHATTAAWTQTYLLLTWPHICTETTDFLNLLYLALTLAAISALLMPIPTALWLDLAMQIRWAGPAVSRKGVSWSSWNALLEIAEIGRLKMRHPDCSVFFFFFFQHPTHSHTHDMKTAAATALTIWG